MGVAQRGLLGRRVAERGQPPRAFARGAAQHRVDELGAAGRLALDELDALADRGVRGDAVEEQQLEEAQAQTGQDGRLEASRRAPGQDLGERVERGAPLDGAIAQLHGQRALATVQAQPLRLPVERPVGPRVLLEDPPQDGECADSCRAGRRPAVELVGGDLAYQTFVQIHSNRLEQGLQSVEAHARKAEGEDRACRCRTTRTTEGPVGLGCSVPHGSLVATCAIAAFVSLGLIAVVLLAGAAITPLVGLNDWPSFPNGGRDTLVRLGNAPPAGAQEPQRSSSSDGTVDQGAAGGGATAPTAAVPVAGAAPGGAVVPRAGGRTSRPLRGRTHDPAPQGRFPAAGIDPVADTDGDGLPDKWEKFYGTDPNRNDADEDPDGDGLTNAQEHRMGTNPRSADTNGDGIRDGDSSADSDGDGLSDGFERRAGTDPSSPDSGGRGGSDAQEDPDGDGLVNAVEQALGLDPSLARHGRRRDPRRRRGQRRRRVLEPRRAGAGHRPDRPGQPSRARADAHADPDRHARADADDHAAGDFPGSHRHGGSVGGRADPAAHGDADADADPHADAHARRPTPTPDAHADADAGSAGAATPRRRRPDPHRDRQRPTPS